MATVVALARATHLAPTVAVTAFTTALAAAAGIGATRAGIVAVAVLAGQASVGWSNDWLDRDRDRAAGRRDKPLVRGDVADDMLRTGAVLALVVCAAVTLLLGWRAAVVHLIAVALAWAYNAGLKSTPVSVVPYMAAFALLPVCVTLALQPPRWPPLWIVAGAALLGGGAHFANTLPDLHADAATGVRGLPHRLGATGSLAAATVLLGLGAAAVPLGAGALPVAGIVALAITGIAVAAVPVSWLRGRRRAAFRLSLVAAGGVVVTLLASGARL